MIATDQPTIFGENPVVGLSSVDDGDMRFIAVDNGTSHQRRIAFLDEMSIEMTQVTRLQASFEGVTDFARYVTLDESYEGEGIVDTDTALRADAMVVTRPDHAIFLLLADCVGAVLYDESNNILMVSHLGRHSTEIEGARRSIEYLVEQFDTNPADVTVWLSPAVGSASYPLHAFEGRSLHDVVIEQLTGAGVSLDRIEALSVDTATSDSYFSHSEYLAGNRTEDGRFAIVAMMRE